MAEIVIYMGESGCGKSTALRNLDPAKTVIISPNGKSLPFPKGNQYQIGKNRILTSELDDVQPTVQHVNDNMLEVNTVVLEDFTHFFTARILSPTFLARNNGGEAFQRWNDFGASVFQTVFSQVEQWRDDLIIVLIHHTELKDTGSIGFKTSGKLLDRLVDPPSYVNYVLHGVVEDTDNGSRYMVQTNKDSVRDAKSSPGCFTDHRIFNDMAKILTRIRAYREGKIEATFIE
jgi:hypothetical protein